MSKLTDVVDALLDKGIEPSDSEMEELRLEHEYRLLSGTNEERLKTMDITEKLQLLADTKIGDDLPAQFNSDPDWAAGNWHIGIAKLMLEAKAEIERLRGLVGGASAGLSFADIRDQMIKEGIGVRIEGGS